VSGPSSPPAVLLSSAVAPGAGLMSLTPCNPSKNNRHCTFCACQVMLPITCLVTYTTQTCKALRSMFLIFSPAMMCNLSNLQDKLSKSLTPVLPQNFALHLVRHIMHTLHRHANAYTYRAASPCQRMGSVKAAPCLE